MASVRGTPTGKWELCVRNKLLPKRVYLTFDTEKQAREYGEQLDRLLAAGIVPAGLVPTTDKAAPTVRVGKLLRDWLDTGQPARSDIEVLELLAVELSAQTLDQLTYAWCETWVADMKRVRNLAPSTLRKRVGSLGRALDWWLRSHPDVSLGNPLKLLPRGFAVYNPGDRAAVLKADGRVKTDAPRDHRLGPQVLADVSRVLDGWKHPERERPLVAPGDVEFPMLFWLIYHTGLRLREAYGVQVGNVNLDQRWIRVATSKQRNGDVVWRVVPIQDGLLARLRTYLPTRAAGGLLFSFWDGDTDEVVMKRVTAKLSARFGNLFEYAGHGHLVEHDLRHEATCRWYEMRDTGGQWLFREAEIYKIMGWKPGSPMGSRYASFRGEDLAARLVTAQSS